jgi:hypothetical protein
MPPLNFHSSHPPQIPVNKILSDLNQIPPNGAYVKILKTHDLAFSPLVIIVIKKLVTLNPRVLENDTTTTPL